MTPALGLSITLPSLPISSSSYLSSPPSSTPLLPISAPTSFTPPTLSSTSSALPLWLLTWAFSMASICLQKRHELGRRRLVFVLVVLSPALVIVDHMHFQYNRFLIGVLLILLALLEEGRDLVGGFAFAVLLCLKHLFAVAAPLYFVYLLRHYCRGGFGRAVGRLLEMGAVVGAVFAVAFGPFVYNGEVAFLGSF